MTATATNVEQAFTAWAEANDRAADLAAALRGRRVRYTGLFGKMTDGPTGRIVGVANTGVRVRWDDPQRMCGNNVDAVHPGNLTAL